MKKIISILLSMLIILSICTGCGITIPPIESTSSQNTPVKEAESEESTSEEQLDTSAVTAWKSEEELFSDRDYRTTYDESKTVLVELKGTTASTSSNSVKIDGTRIMLTEEATYVISGTLEDGMIIVNAPETAKLQLVLKAADIHSETSAPIYILQADKVFLTLEEGTENTLSNGGVFSAIDESDIDAAVFSKQDLTINGSGSLTVTSPAGKGIVCKDDLVITGGTYEIQAASHCIDANDSVRITGASKMTLNAGKDGIHCENNKDASLGYVYISDGAFAIEAQGDGISAGAALQIEKGEFDLLAGGGSINGTKQSTGNYGSFMKGDKGRIPGVTTDDMSRQRPAKEQGSGGLKELKPAEDSNAEEESVNVEEEAVSMKGIKAAGSLMINGGTFQIDSADDGVHSNDSITINGGDFEIQTGDDGMHADNAIMITSGTIHISKSYEGIEAVKIEIMDGNIDLTASDDGINAAGGNDGSGVNGGRDGMFPGGMPGRAGFAGNSNGEIIFSGGSIHIYASGDGVDANGSIEIRGGNIIVEGPNMGDTSTLDYDVSAAITGGSFIGTGAASMAQSFSEAEQGVIALSVGNQGAGTKIKLKDKNGACIIEHTPSMDFSVVILSGPEIQKGEVYTISVGTLSGDTEAN